MDLLKSLNSQYREKNDQPRRKRFLLMQKILNNFIKIIELVKKVNIL